MMVMQLSLLNSVHHFFIFCIKFFGISSVVINVSSETVEIRQKISNNRPGFQTQKVQIDSYKSYTIEQHIIYAETTKTDNAGIEIENLLNLSFIFR